MNIRRFSGPLDKLRRCLAALPCAQDAPEIEHQVAAILAQVRTHGDQALLKYTETLDGWKPVPDDLELHGEALAALRATVPADLLAALHTAADRIRAYHERQRPQSWSYHDEDARLGERLTPLDRVGVYVPGGKAAYPSSVLMNVLPARVAGVREVIMVNPAPRGVSNPVVLAAAAIAGVDRIFRVGGAQAIAALACGTATLPRVDKIVGPGNAYVAAAKRMVFGQVGIDMLAGPSEIVIVADADADPEWLAMDLCAQAEHDEDARAILISPAPALLDAVQQTLQNRLPELERHAVIRASLEKNGALVQSADLEEAVELANQLAPEHLELAVAEPEPLLERVRHAGAVFLGYYSAEVLGDYCAGPNHVLPTGGTARFSSPLGVQDFLKRSSIIHCGPRSAVRLGKIAARLAHSEGLSAHARSAELRCAGHD